MGPPATNSNHDYSMRLLVPAVIVVMAAALIYAFWPASPPPKPEPSKPPEPAPAAKAPEPAEAPEPEEGASVRRVRWIDVAVDPRPATPDRLAKAGPSIYEQQCKVCHGADGRGDGPRAAELNPAPSDFRQHVPFHDDAQLFAFIANGFPGSAMPAWRDQLSEEDIWNIVNFLRSEFSETPAQ